MKKKIMMLLLSLLVIIMGYFGLQAYSQAKQYEQRTQTLVMDKDISTQAEYQAKNWAEKFSLGYYENDKRLLREETMISQKEHQSEAKRYTLYVMGVLLVILCSAFLVDLRLFTFFGALVALVVLTFGLFAPLLTVTIHKEFEYIGDVVLSFESKSLLGSVVKLWENGEMAVALVILLFSILIPLFKTLSLMFVAVVMESRFAHGIVTFFKWVGKWSMLDVFVVATLLVYLTSNGSDVSHAEVQVGLYFFLAYVIVSMLVSLSADRMLGKLKE
ncbi:paraquat-inducible protein A [Sulfurovum sp. XGS-02]|uniref:paraquat-inducible protein A n=1 Tax=Sulfurovum sp. XGS-02 TaxID=2925411 RepID=UPI00204CE759|nr:paraquat-inducible protein A [Sulfurovum sp. XGS-02]UPT77610.1 paraquat-inducible protein A [Sulfurovum sp. XGS-02]